MEGAREGKKGNGAKGVCFQVMREREGEGAFQEEVEGGKRGGDRAGVKHVLCWVVNEASLDININAKVQPQCAPALDQR